MPAIVSSGDAVVWLLVSCLCDSGTLKNLAHNHERGFLKRLKRICVWAGRVGIYARVVPSSNAVSAWAQVPTLPYLKLLARAGQELINCRSRKARSSRITATTAPLGNLLALITIGCANIQCSSCGIKANKR